MILHVIATAQQISRSPLERRNLRAMRRQVTHLESRACHGACAMCREARLICRAAEVGMRNQSRQQLKRQVLLTQRAYEMRRQLTPSESALWSQISRNQLGVAFRRQMLIGNRYIVDFLAPSVGLVVEVDGAYHARCAVADARRERHLQGLGFRVIRLDANLVLTRLAEVVEEVREAIGPNI